MGSLNSTELCCFAKNQPKIDSEAQYTTESPAFRAGEKKDDEEISKSQDEPLMSSKRSDMRFVTKTTAEMDKINAAQNRGAPIALRVGAHALPRHAQLLGICGAIAGAPIAAATVSAGPFGSALASGCCNRDMLPNGLSAIHASNGSQAEQSPESAAARLEKILSLGLAGVAAQSTPAAPPPQLAMTALPAPPGLPPPGPPPLPPLSLVAGLPSPVSLTSNVPLSMAPPAPPMTVPQTFAAMGQSVLAPPPPAPVPQPPPLNQELTQQPLGMPLVAQLNMTSPASFGSPSSMTAMMLSAALTSPAGVLGTSSVAPVGATSVQLPSANDLENIAIAHALGHAGQRMDLQSPNLDCMITPVASSDPSAASTKPGTADSRADGQRIEALHPEAAEAVRAELAAKASASAAREAKASKQSRRADDLHDGKDDSHVKTHENIGKPKKRKATRRIEEIWGFGQEDRKDVLASTDSHNQQTAAERKEERKRRRDKSRIEELWAQTEPSKQLKAPGQSQIGKASPQLEPEQSQTALALLGSAEAEPVNEALEKAKAAMAAIESQAEQSQQTLRDLVPEQPSGEIPSQQQLAAWMSAADNMSSEQQMAVHSAAAAAQQAQFMQQFQFFHQYRQHEHQRTQTGSTGSTASRFQDGYMPLFLCKKLIQFGACPRGESCTFAHSFEELHPASPDLPKMDGTASGMPSVLSEQTQEVDQMPDVKMKRKRSMCQRYQKGECLLGKQCPFAHKEEDLGTVELVLCGNVKTRICKMWTQGKCIYAVNCWDAHGEKEIGLKRPPPELAPKIKRVRKEPYEERKQKPASSSQVPD